MDGFHTRTNITDLHPDALGAQWTSLVDCVQTRGQMHPDRTSFIYLRDGEVEAGRLTFGALDARARAAGAALRARGCEGGRVLLAYPQGLDFIVAFMAVLYAGGTAVPAPAANAGRVAKARIQSIIADADLAAILTTPDLRPFAQEIVTDGSDGSGPMVPVATLPDLEAEGQGAPAPGPMDPDAVALIQYTSGSTGTPKGVMVTHRNIMANQWLITDRFEHGPETVTIGWLPMFHDMGLIGNTLNPIFTGGHCVLMSPGAFLQDPIRWLRAVDTYRGTTAGAPNFAFDLCVDRTRPEDRAALDLSSWSIAYNGSEPVRAATAERFVATFAAQGFRAEACYPCYGMAEATLLIAGCDKAALPTTRQVQDGDDPEPRTLVACGVTSTDHALAIVDPDTFEERPDGDVGEIWFSGGSVAVGYWNQPELSARDFGQSIAGQTDGRAWMRTGDLGFKADGQIYITGRIKDVIIVRGRNHYPQDIEATVQACHRGLKPHGGAAFVVDEEGGRQRLVVVHEVVFSALRNPPVAEMAAAIRKAVTRAHGLHVAGVVLIKTAAIPKTSSGKIQRRRCRQLYLDGTLRVIGEDIHGPPLRSPSVDMAAT